jgi:hypothetical protein
LTLENRFAVPLEAKPFQILHRGVGEFQFAALGVGILDAEEDFAAGFPGTGVGCRKGGRVAEVQKSRRGGGDPASVFHFVAKISLESGWE